MGAFIPVVIVAVVGVALAIFFFLGKNGEADDKKDAQELASDRQSQIDSLEGDVGDLQDEVGELETQLEAATGESETLNELVDTGLIAADNLKFCADGAIDFFGQFADALPNIVATGVVPPELEALADQVDADCALADDSYFDFLDALDQIGDSGDSEEADEDS